MKSLLKISIIISFIALQLLANGQTVDKEPLTTKELNDHVGLLLQKKKIYKRLIRKDQNGAPAIFINLKNFRNLKRNEPYNNNGINYYYWSPEELFFHNIDSRCLGLLSYSHNWYNSRYTFIANDLYIEMQIIHVGMVEKKKIPPEISQLKISKIKRLTD